MHHANQTSFKPGSMIGFRTRFRKGKGRLCTVPGCYLQHYAKGVCLAHYDAARLNKGRRNIEMGLTARGDLRKPKGKNRKDPRLRFESKIMPLDYVGCWLWLATANTTGGRGNFWDGHKQVNAPRAAWEIYRGKIPEGMIVCHKCDNEWCVNPDHLFIGSYADNVHDCIRKGRHHFAKITPAQAAAVRASTGTHREVAERFGIHKNSVAGIRSGHSWNWV